MTEKDDGYLNNELNWLLRNPVNAALLNRKGFVCFHTHSLTKEDISGADNRSIEIDVQEVNGKIGDYDSDVVVSHHPWAYLKYGNNPPRQEEMMRAEDVVEAVAGRNIFVKFDIKSATVKTYKWVMEQAKKIKPENRMLHVFLKELHAVSVSGIEKPYKQDAPTTVAELVDLKALKIMKEDLGGIPVQVSCRGFNKNDISKRKEDKFPLIDELCERVRGIATIINFNLMDGWKGDDRLREEIMQYVWDHFQMMIELNVDAGETAPEGVPYLGRSDKMEKVTRLV